MTKKIFEQGMFIFGRQFPEKTIDFEILWQFLKDLTDEQYINAIKELVTTKEEINKASNLVALIREKATCQQIKTGGEAWGVVMKAVSRFGSYRNPKFKDPAIQKCVDAIGWRNICLSETPMVERAHFLRIYDTICEREKNKVLSGPVKLLIKNITERIEAK